MTFTLPLILEEAEKLYNKLTTKLTNEIIIALLDYEDTIITVTTIII